MGNVRKYLRSRYRYVEGPELALEACIDRSRRDRSVPPVRLLYLSCRYQWDLWVNLDDADRHGNNSCVIEIVNAREGAIGYHIHWAERRHGRLGLTLVGVACLDSYIPSYTDNLV